MDQNRVLAATQRDIESLDELMTSLRRRNDPNAATQLPIVQEVRKDELEVTERYGKELATSLECAKVYEEG